MHFEILVEDVSGKKFLDNIVPKIIGDNSFNVISYKGVGRIPPNMNKSVDASKRILLDNLPRLLSGYGKSWQWGYEAVVIVVCDLDNKCLKSFRDDLTELLNNCNPAPTTCFCIAIEEGEAWLLGDITAIKQAYPNAKDAILKSYINDSICRTWEKLADAIYQGGSKKLSEQGWVTIGKEKSNWAENITPYMVIDNNTSPSFNCFVQQLKSFI